MHLASAPALATLLALTSILSAATGCGDDSSPTGTPAEPQVPSGFVSICETVTTACNARTTPPTITGNYTGSGETISTTSELWGVGNSETFSATIVDAGDGRVTGTFTMESFELVVESAEIRGEGTQFTIYGVDSVQTGGSGIEISASGGAPPTTSSGDDAGQTDGCTLEARAVITGITDDATTPVTLSGELTLVGTDNVTGDDCTPEQIADYPGTGATFSYTATRVP